MRKRELKQRYAQLEDKYVTACREVDKERDKLESASARIAELEQRLGEIADIAGGYELLPEHSEFELIGVQVMPIDGGGFAERGLQRNGLWFVRDTESSAWGQDKHLMTAYRKMMDCKRTMERE